MKHLPSLLTIVLLLCGISRAASLPPFNLPEKTETKSVNLPGDFTIAWWQYIDLSAVAKPQTFLRLDKLRAGTKPLADPKGKAPPHAAFTAGELQSKLIAYPDRWYHLAIVRHDGKIEMFVNGQPDGTKITFAEALSGTPAGDFAAIDAVDRALPAEQILAQFKSAIPPRSIVTVGHRGDNHGSPENTNISYVNAIANKTPIVEMDLRLTKDNVLVLLHDPTVNRTTGAKGAIADLTLEESQRLDAGFWKDPRFRGEKIPKVEEICNTCRGKAVMMLDLKCTGLGKSLAELKQKVNFPSDAWILAPWEEVEGVELRKYLANVPMILLHSKIPTDNFDDSYFANMKKIGFGGFSIDWRNLTQDFIDACRKHDMKVFTWTVNEAPEIAGAVLANVDGIITDDAPGTMKLVNDLTTAKN